MGNGQRVRPLVLRAAERALRGVDNTANRVTLSKAMRILAPANTIFLTGLKRLPATMFSLHRALNASGIRNLIVDQVPGMASEMIECVTSSDAAVIAYSESIDTETQGLIEHLTSRNVPFISFSDGPDDQGTSRSWAHFNVAENSICGYELSVAGLCLATSLVRCLDAYRNFLGHQRATT